MNDRGILETLLWDCFQGPGTCVADRGLSVTIAKPPAGAAVLAFRLDTAAFREATGLVGKRCCDGLLLVLEKPPQREPSLQFFVVEMKGRKHEDALEQLVNALTAIRESLRERLPEIVFRRARFTAVIISDRPASGRLPKEAVDAFRTEYKADLFVHHLEEKARPADISRLASPWSKERTPGTQ